jgi:hypothetical protein
MLIVCCRRPQANVNLGQAIGAPVYSSIVCTEGPQAKIELPQHPTLPCREQRELFFYNTMYFSQQNTAPPLPPPIVEREFVNIGSALYNMQYDIVHEIILLDYISVTIQSL